MCPSPPKRIQFLWPNPSTPELSSRLAIARALVPPVCAPGFPSRFVSIVQAFLFLVHIALYATWTFFWGASRFFTRRATANRAGRFVRQLRRGLPAGAPVFQSRGPRHLHHRLGVARPREFLFSGRLRMLDCLRRAAFVRSAPGKARGCSRVLRPRPSRGQLPPS